MAKFNDERLSELLLFHNLDARELSWLAERLHCKNYPAGANIMSVEQPGEVVYFIMSGTVKVHIEQLDGNDVVLAILGRGDTVGEMSLIDSAGRSASAVTLEDSSLLWMDRQSFQEGLRTIPNLALNLVRILSRRVRQANEQIQTLATLNVYGRVARQLLAFAEKYGSTAENGHILIPIRLTQSDIADLVGASRKRVNQVIVTFKSQQYITVDPSGRITVINRAGLARHC